MKIEQRQWTADRGWTGPERPLAGAQWVLVFGSAGRLRQPDLDQKLRDEYPHAFRMGCSTAGEIAGDDVQEGSLVLTAVRFDRTPLQGYSDLIQSAKESRAVGERLGRRFCPEGLTHVFVIAEGIHINGADLAAGLLSVLPRGVSVTGGLAGDGSRFRETLVMANGPAMSNQVAAVGFYGTALRIGYGSMGGWEPFGPDRRVTRAKGNVLYELDGQSALALYQNHLGVDGRDLPASGLNYPLSLRAPESATGVVRTLVAVNDVDQSMTFGGNIPTGHLVRLLKTSYDRLIDGAVAAADGTRAHGGSPAPDLAVLISCVGRKLILKGRTEEEVQGVRRIMGNSAAFAGYYSYGQLSPVNGSSSCDLHNQTMTLTTFAETD